MPCSHAVVCPFSPLLANETRAVFLAVAVKVLTSRTCPPPHPTLIAAAGAVDRWFAAASNQRFFRAVAVVVVVAVAVAVVVAVIVAVAVTMAMAAVIVAMAVTLADTSTYGPCLCGRGRGRGCGCVATVGVVVAVNVGEAVGRGCGRSGFRGGSEGRGTRLLAAATS